jgi:hypothetical protein
MSTKQFIWPKAEELIFVRPPKEEYHGNLDSFYEPELFPELAPLKDNWKEIRNEIVEFEKRNGALSGMSSVNPASAYGGNWTLIYLMSFSRKNHKNRSDFPFICSIIDKIPNIVFAAVSVLPPHTELAPHFGDTNGIVRSHLGLIIPAEYPTIAIRVGEEERGWKEGELLCFINVQKHSVWNRSAERRYVLMIDFVPKILENRQEEICAKGLGSQSFIYLYKNISLVRKLPNFVYPFMCWVATLIWRIYLPFQRRLKFLP